MRHEIFMAGTGGQGVLLIGQLLAQAAMAEGRASSYVPIYTPEVRGGSTTCMIVIADGTVGSPIIGRPAAMLLMDQLSVDTHALRLQAGGLALLNATFVRHWPGQEARLIWIPATEKALSLGSERIANMIMLGAYATYTGAVSLAALEEALPVVLPERHHRLLPLNRAALQAGAELIAQQALDQISRSF